MPLTKEQAAALLKESESRTTGGGGRVKVDPTSIRELPVWWKLSHHIREEGCENPDCKDPRKNPEHESWDKENNKPSRGVNICAEVKGKWMCRDCYISGWLV